MRITVIGTLNKDLILPFTGAPIESFGGIFYDIAVLSNLSPENEIIPVSFIGEDVETTVKAILNKTSNVSTDGLVTLPEKNHKVILEYSSPNKRQEKSLFQFPALTWEHIAPFVDSDMIIVNLISGWDLEKEAFLQLSKIARDRLYLDVHYLVMGLDNLGRRHLRMPENVEDWLSGSKFVQMNEDEYALLAGGCRNEVDFYQKYMKDDQVLIATKSVNGAVLVYQRDRLIGQKQLPAFTIPQIIDTTGCGDAFGAGFATKYLETGDMIASAKYANLTAAANIMLRGTNEMHQLLETMEMLQVE